MMRLSCPTHRLQLRVHQLLATVVVTASVVLVAGCGSGEQRPGAQATSEGPAAEATGETSPIVTPTTPESPDPASPTVPESADATGGPATSGTTYLRNLETVSGGPEGGSAELNGQTFFESLIFWTYGGKTNGAEYNLGRDWQRLEATIGLRDDAPSDSKMRFQVFADGRRIYERTLVLGQSQPITLNVIGVLRLRLVTSLLSPSGISDSANGVWGDARLVAGT